MNIVSYFNSQSEAVWDTIWTVWWIFCFYLENLYLILVKSYICYATIVNHKIFIISFKNKFALFTYRNNYEFKNAVQLNARSGTQTDKEYQV